MDVSSKVGLIRSFVFGNGRTRINIDFASVQPYGEIFACNAVYREYSPDHLIVVDKKMITEIDEVGYQNKNNVWINDNVIFNKFKGFKKTPTYLGWSSGPTALYLAAHFQPSEIYIFGFDYEGIDGKYNNIFANTPNYKNSDSTPVYYKNWLNQTENVIKSNPNINFYRVNIPNFFPILWCYDNYLEITYEKFMQNLSTWKKIR